MHSRRHRLAQRRKAVGLSQERLAEVVGVDRSTVVRWERADTEPQPWHRPRLAAALRVTVEELAVLLADVGEPAGRPDERFDYVLRNPGSVDLVAAAYLRERVNHLDALYESTPSTLLLAETGQLHGQAVFLLEHTGPGSVRQQLHAAVADSATLMGQLVWDASQRRDHRATIRYFDQAIAAARRVRDVVAEANAELRKSYVALYGIGDPKIGLVIASRAAAASLEASNVIAGLALLHAGEAHAMLNDQHGCESALGEAADCFSRISPDDPAGLLFCPSQHGRLAGSCWLFLGEPAKAEPVLEQTRKILVSHRKASAIVLGNLALASIRQRNIEAATDRLHEAIDEVKATRGGGGLNVVFEAARELRPWRNEPAVQEVNDRLLALMAAA